MSFIFTWKNPATINWNILDDDDQPVVGAVVTATLYKGRSIEQPDQTPGAAVDGMDGLALMDQGAGLYQSELLDETIIPVPGTDYVLVIDATVAGISIRHWEEPTTVVAPGTQKRIALCELTDLKQHLGISPTDTSNDAWLNRLILATSNDFLTSIRRPQAFIAMDHKDTIDVRNCQSESHREDVFLRHYPINTIASVTINTLPFPVYDESNPALPGYFFDKELPDEERQKITLMGFYYPMFAIWPSLFRSIYRTPLARVIVEYNAGYQEIPPDVSQAVIEWVAFKKGMSELQRKDQTTEWLQLGQMQAHISTAATTLKINGICMPDSVAGVIEKYERPIVG